MHVCVIGAGVNGICCAIGLAEKGCRVTVYDSSKPLKKTSAKSSKLLHGGLRYLEHFEFKLVKKALAERAWWVKNAGEHTMIRRFYVPIYKGVSRSRIKLFLGVKTYEWLAGRHSLGASQHHTAEETIKHNPDLSTDKLLGSVSYMDVQMDDIKLSNWLVERSKSLGVTIITNTVVKSIKTDGTVELADGVVLKYTKVINAAGPWAKELIDRSQIKSAYSLALVKGSHLVINRTLPNPLVIQNQSDGRIVFALPLGNNTLIGTTEVPVQASDKVICSDQETEYLINSVNNVMKFKISTFDIHYNFTGVRPIVSDKFKIKDLTRASRDTAIETIGNLTNIFGGKWTSAMYLGRDIANMTINSTQTKL